MSKRSDHVKQWRKNTKARIVEAFGGCCCICGYNKCDEGLDLHHLDPNKKEMSLGSIRANSKSWDTIVKELRKCVMVCATCHREVHIRLSSIPDDAPRFNETYADYKSLKSWKKDQLDPCPICGELKPLHLITCSPQCAAKKAHKVDWDSIDLVEMKNSGMTNVAIADEIGVSEMSVRKRLKKLEGK